MKKISYISALCLTLTLGATSCKNEVDDIFSQSAAERTEAAQADYTDFLTKNGGKWAMSYFPNSNESGYTYVVTFKTDGTVQMSGKNIYINYQYTRQYDTPLYKSESSLWEVISDNGPVLTFNSYNPTFHLFADPYDIPGTSNPDSENDIDETGYGHEGDYEFVLVEKVDDNTMRLKGKKTGITVMLNRLDAATDDETYLNSIDEMRTSLLSTQIPNLIFTGEDGVRYISKLVTTSAENSIPTLQFTFYPEDGDAVTQSTTRNFMVTASGIRLMTAFHGEDSTFTAQNFVRQADGSLLCSDDNKSNFNCDLGNILSNTSLRWRIDKNNCGGIFADLITEMDAQFRTAFKARTTYIDLKYSTTKKSLALVVKVGTYQEAEIYYNTSDDSDRQITINFTGEANDPLGITFLSRISALKSLCEALSAKFDLSTECPTAPTSVKLSAANSADYIVVNIR